MKYGRFIQNPEKATKIPPLEGVDIPHDVLWRDTENPAKYWVMDTDERPWKVKSEHSTLDMAERVCKRLNDKRGREQYQVLGFGVENPSNIGNIQAPLGFVKIDTSFNEWKTNYYKDLEHYQNIAARHGFTNPKTAVKGLFRSTDNKHIGDYVIFVSKNLHKAMSE